MAWRQRKRKWRKLACEKRRQAAAANHGWRNISVMAAGGNGIIVSGWRQRRNMA